MQSNSNIIQVFTLFMKAIFSRVRHPSHPGRGHGSLTCHMTQFERSDWLRSANFTNIIIELLTHWGRVRHICISKITIIGSDNGLSPGRHQAIIWTNDGILFIGPLGTNFTEMLIKMYTFSLKKKHLKILSAKWQHFVSASMFWNTMTTEAITDAWKLSGKPVSKLLVLLECSEA